ncbi:MAG: response regulator [Thiobacillaceae bacterium]|nr:response regulator [Thiobacillaceae bacterium]MCX7672122.1 response regulator [Thiobacillaceae bacterium]MDW8324853.1 response regulator [Burkholderiales bacterium]
MRVLLVEDDPMIGAALTQGLRPAGFSVDWVRDGSAAEAALDAQGHVLVLLDLGLPRLDGLSLLRRLRGRGLTLPVLIITARDAVDDRVRGLNLGADDYLVKPFDLNELIARMHALIRRANARAAPQLRLGPLVLDPIARTATLDDQPLALSPREFDLLHALMERPGAVMSVAQLEARLYGWDETLQSNAVEVHLHHLRRKLGSAWIRNVRGVGYKLALPT